MQQQDPLVDAQIRSARYWNVDGLSEIAVGLQVLLVPAFLYVVAHTSRGSLGRVAAVLAFALGLPAVMFLTPRVLVAVRRRFTYRRTGFVAYRQDRRAWVFGVGLAVSLAVLLLALMATGRNWIAYLFVLQALIPGGLTFYLGRIVGLVRFQAIGVLYIGFGLGVALAQPDLIRGMTIFWTAVGAMFLVFGGLTFWRYVRLHPATAAAQ